MENIKIKFVDFSATSFDPERQWIIQTLKKKYNILFSDTPDFLFYSTWGLEYLNYSNCVRVFCGGEPISPNFNECDYAFGFEPITFKDRYMQYPVGDSDSPGLYDIDPSIQDRSQVTEDLFDRKFCNFIYSQDWAGEGAILRREFCKGLMQYRQVDCPSYVLNNMPKGAIADRWTDGFACGSGVVTRSWSNGKVEFLKNYKFTIAFENTAMSGLTTEKLVQPFQTFSIPIYWGNPDVAETFNSKAFINCYDYDCNFEKIIARIKELDEDKNQYLAMLRESPLQDSFDFQRPARAEEFLFNLIEKGNRPFAKDATNISSAKRIFNELQDVQGKLGKAQETLTQLGIDYDSNTWKLVRKLQKFGDSKWGYLPKKVFHFVIKVYQKLKKILGKT